MRARVEEKSALLLISVLLAAILLAGWRFFAEDAEPFPVFSNACIWLDSHLEQTQHGAPLYRSLGNFLREVICRAEATRERSGTMEHG